MPPKKKSMAFLVKHASSLKKLREQAERLRTLSTQPEDVDNAGEERFRSPDGNSSFGSFDDRRLGWPEPARFPSEGERRGVEKCTKDSVAEHVPVPNESEPCSPSAFDSRGEFSATSDDDGWTAAAGCLASSSDVNSLDFRAPLPRSVTIRDLPDWRACKLLGSKNSPYTEEESSRKQPSVQAMSRLRRCSQRCSTSSSLSSDSSSETWKYEEKYPRSRTLLKLPEASEFLSRLAYQRHRALCAASALDEDHQEEDLAALSSGHESEEWDDEACRPRRTKTRSDFPHPAEYLSPMAYQRFRALCGASPLDEHDAVAVASIDKFCKWRDQGHLPKPTQARSGLPSPEG